MVKNKKKTRACILSISLVGIIILGIFSNTVVALQISANSTYQINIAKGTEILEVSRYDESSWEETINDSPESLFGGDAEKINAKSKYTTLSWFDNATTTYEGFISLFISLEMAIVVSTLGFNQSVINSNYTNKYDSWMVYRAKWEFNSTDFPESANNPNYLTPVFKDPADYKKLLDDYNNWTDIINNDIGFLAMGLPAFQNFTADEFLWQLVLKGMIIATPNNEYLEALVDGLGCSSKIEVNGNELTITKTGIKSYTVDVIYGAQGTQTSLTIKDKSGNIIYEVTTIYPHLIFIYIILGIISGCLAVIVVVKIKAIKKRRLEMTSVKIN